MSCMVYNHIYIYTCILFVNPFTFEVRILRNILFLFKHNRQISEFNGKEIIGKLAGFFGGDEKYGSMHL